MAHLKSWRLSDWLKARICRHYGRWPIDIPRTTFYRWYDLYLQRGEAGLKDKPPKPKHVWKRIPGEIRHKVVKLALKETELSPRELAVTFTDRESIIVVDQNPTKH